MNTATKTKKPTDTPKCYYVQNNVGTVKYLVSFHDGYDTHKDGSAFFGIKGFKNKKKLKKFIDNLCDNGYIEK